MKQYIKITILTVIFVSAIVLTIALFRYEGFSMKGSESRPGNYLKEESFWERYGVSPEGLVLWLDQSDPRSYGDASNWYDMSGKGNNGTQTTVASQPRITSGSNFAGFARDFDGTNDYVGVSSLGSMSQGTVLVWAKFDDTSIDNTQAIVGVAIVPGALYLGWQWDFNLAFIMYDTAWRIASSGMIPTVNTWYHIVGTWDTNGHKIYVNGQFKGSYTGGIGLGSAEFRIGDFNDIGRELNGFISEVQILNRALSAAEIERLYLADKPRHGGL